MKNNEKYAKAYTEVLEIISHLPKDEYNKIPNEKINFYKDNMDKEYTFKIDTNIDLANQNISREANSIIVMLYKDYFANEEQKEEINKKLNLNLQIEEEEKRKRYNPKKLFKTKNKLDNIEISSEKDIIIYKENFFTKLKNYICKLLHIHI